MEKDYMKVGKHAIKQFIGDEEINKKFSPEKVKRFVDETGLILPNEKEEPTPDGTDRPLIENTYEKIKKINSFGVVLNNTQMRVFEAILKALTNTNYKGDEQKTIRETIAKNYIGQNAGQIIQHNENAPYKNINTIPVIRVTQKELIELAGYDPRKQNDRQMVVEALEFLRLKPFCFYWERAKYKDGQIVKGKDGKIIMEPVSEVSTLLRLIKVYKEPERRIIDYYEIYPSACMLDQINNYFLLIPNNWREEVKRITGQTASSYTYLFLLWLRMEFESIRSYNDYKRQKKGYKKFVITITYTNLAKTLKMPESLYKKKKKKAIDIIRKCYITALRLGYITSFDVDEGLYGNKMIYTFYLNEDFYPQPGKLV